MEHVVTSGQFRFAYFTPLYDVTVAFYRDGLDLPVIEAWDRSPEDRGTLFGAASGLIEVLALPQSVTSSMSVHRKARLGMEVHEVAAAPADKEKGLVSLGLKDQTKNHAVFACDPNGLTLLLQ
jgi:catechol 2,3-dioxygenase-like lactoylglutathione lyase family enzyme